MAVPRVTMDNHESAMDGHERPWVAMGNHGSAMDDHGLGFHGQPW